jgi:protease IV
MKFLSSVLATIVGLFIFSMIFFFGFALIGALVGGDKEGVTVSPDSVIELNLENVTDDYAGKYADPWMSFFSNGRTVGISDVVKAIEAAGKDDKIRGISILNNTSGIGVAQAKAIRDALEGFRKSKKFIVSYSNTYSQKEYYIGSVADTVYLNPVGEMEFKGLATELMFFKDLQDKSGVKMEVIRHGKYKSAVEPFLDNKMSPANREQLTTLLGSVWQSILADISRSRHIAVPQLNAIADGLLARTPEMAKQQKLIDRIAYEDEYHAGIRKAL